MNYNDRAVSLTEYSLGLWSPSD